MLDEDLETKINNFFTNPQLTITYKIVFFKAILNWCQDITASDTLLLSLDSIAEYFIKTYAHYYQNREIHHLTNRKKVIDFFNLLDKINYDINDTLTDDKISSIDDFLGEITKVAEEFYRVLKPGKNCAILIGDIRREKHQVPISYRVMQAFLEIGFVLKENIIKLQHNTKTEHFWQKQSIKSNFLLLSFEQLFVFRKPEEREAFRKNFESKKWWDK